MIGDIVRWLYSHLTPSQIKALGRSSWLAPLRNWLLRGKPRLGMMEVRVSWGGLDFFYHGDVKSSLKAKRKGIEGSLLRLSMKLLHDVKSRSDNAVILDVGASYGFLSSVWALSSSKRGQVFAFEASPDVFTVAKTTARKNGLENLTYINQAVYNFDGRVLIQPFDGTRALITDDHAGAEVECITIDSFCEQRDIHNIDLIKIDVDGPEYEVLQGAQKVMASCRPIFILESNNDKRLLSFFDPARYMLFDLAFQPLADNVVPSTIVAVPKEVS